MGSEVNAKAPLKVVKLDRALKIAEGWVDKMSGSSTEEAIDKEYEGRPPRLGLGAIVKNHTEVDDLSDPVKRKILKKLGVGKKNPSSNDQGNLNKSKPNTTREDESDEESDSRVNAFTKKREAAVPAATSVRKDKKKPKCS